MRLCWKSSLRSGIGFKCSIARENLRSRIEQLFATHLIIRPEGILTFSQCTFPTEPCASFLNQLYFQHRMAVSQKRSTRKPSGGRYKRVFSKQQHELGSKPTHTHLGKVHKSSSRMMGGNRKQRLLVADIANVLDPKTKKFKVAKIKTVKDSQADPNFIRRNIMVKGAVIDTEIGKAKITNRPGQSGAINAVLVE